MPAGLPNAAPPPPPPLKLTMLKIVCAAVSDGNNSRNEFHLASRLRAQLLHTRPTPRAPTTRCRKKSKQIALELSNLQSRATLVEVHPAEEFVTEHTPAHSV